MNKFLYPIKNLHIETWLKYWLLKRKVSHYIPSEYIEGTILNLPNSVAKAPIDFNILGNTIQDGEPTPESPVPINSVGDNINIFDKDTMATRIYRYLNVDNTWRPSDDSYSIAIPCLPNNVYAISHNKDNATIFRCGYIKEMVIPETGYITVYNQYRGTTDKSHILETGADATYIIFQGDLALMPDIINTLKIEQGSQATLYSPYNMGVATIVKSNSDNTQSEAYPIYTQAPMRSIGEVRDDFIKQAAVRYERHKIGHIASYDGETITTAYMSTTGELSTGAEVIYILAEPTLTECTSEQVEQLENIINDPLYDGETNYFSNDEVSPYLRIKYYMKEGN